MAASGNVTVKIEMKDKTGNFIPGEIYKYVNWVSYAVLKWFYMIEPVGKDISVTEIVQMNARVRTFFCKWHC